MLWVLVGLLATAALIGASAYFVSVGMPEYIPQRELAFCGFTEADPVAEPSYCDTGFTCYNTTRQLPQGGHEDEVRALVPPQSYRAPRDRAALTPCRPPARPRWSICRPSSTASSASARTSSTLPARGAICNCARAAAPPRPPRHRAARWARRARAAPILALTPSTAWPRGSADSVRCASPLSPSRRTVDPEAVPLLGQTCALVIQVPPPARRPRAAWSHDARCAQTHLVQETSRRIANRTSVNSGVPRTAAVGSAGSRAGERSRTGPDRTAKPRTPRAARAAAGGAPALILRRRRRRPSSARGARRAPRLVAVARRATARRRRRRRRHRRLRHLSVRKGACASRRVAAAPSATVWQRRRRAPTALWTTLRQMRTAAVIFA